MSDYPQGSCQHQLRHVSSRGNEEHSLPPKPPCQPSGRWLQQPGGKVDTVPSMSGGRTHLGTQGLVPSSTGWP